MQNIKFNCRHNLEKILRVRAIVHSYIRAHANNDYDILQIFAVLTQGFDPKNVKLSEK